MEIIVFLLAMGVLAFLVRVGLIIHQACCMDFNFNRPWPNEIPSADQVKKNKESASAATQQELELKELSGMLVSQT